MFSSEKEYPPRGSSDSPDEANPHFWLECRDCLSTNHYDPLDIRCPQCGGDWQMARYDLERASGHFANLTDASPHNLWRYRELLPIANQTRPPTLGEGYTPLHRAEQLGLLLGLDHLYIKDERQNPTRSFKDRQAAVSTALLLEHGLSQAVVCSTGNVALAFSAACARSGIKLWAFLTSRVPSEKMREVAVYGTKVIKVTGTYDEAKQLAADFASQRNIYLDRGARSMGAVESMKTIAFEVAEQLPSILPQVHDLAWQAPDWYLQAVSGGLGPIGVLKGFKELHAMQLTSNVPAMAVIQIDGCAPMVHAWKAGLASAEPVLTPRTHITTLTTGDPGRSYTHLREEMQHGSGGVMESVTDEEAFQALHIVAKLEGISVEPAAAAAFAGLIKLARSGVLGRHQRIVVNCSGHTMPVEAQLLAPGWSQDINSREFSLPDRPRDGLLAALDALNHDTTKRILIVDDNADARRLVRRVLETNGSYTVIEAPDGKQALHDLDLHRPDLVILDLMMPEMDGFEVIEKIKSRSGRSDIPIIVVTAKELSPGEAARLEGRIKRLLIKGDYLGDDLVSSVDTILE